MKYLKQRENQVYYYYRRAPKDIKLVIGKSFIKQSLATQDYQTARDKADQINKEFEVIWNELRLNGYKYTDIHEKRYQRVKRIAEILFIVCVI